MNNSNSLRDRFARSIPEFQRIAASHFRDLDSEAREEMVQNVLALAWKFYHRLIELGRGEEPGIMKSTLYFAVRQTKSGRKVDGCPKTKDAFEKRRTGKVVFEYCQLDQFISKTTPPPEAASFRIDVPQFLATLTERQQKMADGLMAGMSTSEMARKIGITPGAVSQFRSRFKDLYEDYFGE